MRQRSVAAPSEEPKKAKLLDEDEQEAVIRSFEREAETSAKLFRGLFVSVSVALTLAVLYMALKSSLFRQPEVFSITGSTPTDYPRVVASVLSAAGVALHALQVARFRPGISARIPPLRFDPFLRYAVAHAVVCVAYFVAMRADFEVFEVVWWVWPVAYHAAATASVSWMQEVREGINGLREKKYQYKSA
jgi:hypothetical protein